MSFSRFGWEDSDVYVFEHVGGFIQCCGCWLEPGDKDGWFYDAKTPREMLSHLETHEIQGHNVTHARKRILEEYEDLDVTIEPYKPTEEDQKRIDEFWRKIQGNE